MGILEMRCIIIMVSDKLNVIMLQIIRESNGKITKQSYMKFTQAVSKYVLIIRQQRCSSKVFWLNT